LLFRFLQIITNNKNIILEKTNDRIKNNIIVDEKNPCNYLDEFEYSENFDRKLILNNKTYYFNFKFVCDQGGAQKRTLKLTYNFIESQLNILKYTKNKNIYFINILDGDVSSKKINKLKFIIKKNKCEKYQDNIYIGDLHDFYYLYGINYLISEIKINYNKNNNFNHIDIIPINLADPFGIKDNQQ